MLSLSPFDDRVPTAAAVRVRALVLVEIRPSTRTLVVARHRPPMVVPAPVADLSGDVTRW